MRAAICSVIVIVGVLVGTTTAAADSVTTPWMINFQSIGVFTGSCRISDDGKLRVCQGTQTSGSPFSEVVRFRPGHCDIVITPTSPGRDATAYMVCTPAPSD